MHRLWRTVRLGLGNLLLHPLRSTLTVLGIFCGVASVIVMLAFGEGTSYTAQQRIRALGSTNVIVRSQKPPESARAGAGRSFVIDYGLTYLDADRIRESFPTARVLVPIREIVEDVRFEERRAKGTVVGTVPWFLEVANQKVGVGRFLTAVEMERQGNSCVIGPRIAADLFPYQDPIGRTVKVRSLYFRVVGVMAEGGEREIEGVRIAGGENAVYIPVTTARSWFGETLVKIGSGSREMERVELHELDVQVASLEDVLPTKRAIEEMLRRTHPRGDWIVKAPLNLLQAAEQTKREFNRLLGSVAAVSLLVGGIGIMNIMLASVTERTREIGIRRALGARRRDITLQFLVECVVLAATGGFLGTLVGVGGPILYEALTKTILIVTPWSVGMALGISVLVGIVFGLYPAQRAARMDPIEALRHE
ncbi:MAG TPA: ABC transporter permease [Planctomycetota bacterium]|nr:ABC transporter permease [Planctomycetota bacterium]